VSCDWVTGFFVGTGDEGSRGLLRRGDDNLDALLKFSTGNLQEIQRMADSLQEV